MADENRNFLRSVGDFLVGPHFWRLIALIIVATLLGLAVVLIFRTSPEIGFANAEFARGLITLLLLVSVIAAALTMIFATLFLPDESAEKVPLKDRIAYGRDVMAPLVGILGTIVGFYFGSQQSKEIVDVQKKAAEVVAAAAGTVGKSTAGAVEEGAAKGAEKGVVKGVEKVNEKGTDPIVPKADTNPRSSQDTTKVQADPAKANNPAPPR